MIIKNLKNNILNIFNMPNMSKKKFFNILSKEISQLSFDEQQNILDFYVEYFNNSESDIIAIESLPSPYIIAQNLYDELGIKKKVHFNNSIYIGSLICTILSITKILLLPIIITILISIITMLFSIFVIIPVSLLASSIIVLIIAMWAIIPAFLYNLGTGVIFLGYILLGLGCSILFTNITISGYNITLNIYKKMICLLKIIY